MAVKSLCARLTQKTGSLVSAHIVNADDHDTNLVVTSAKGQIIRIPLDGISVLGRATQGVRIMKSASGDKVAGTTVL